MVRDSQQESEKKSNWAERLRAARQLLGLTQDELGKQWGFSGNYVYLLESERKPIAPKLHPRIIQLEREVRQKLGSLPEDSAPNFTLPNPKLAESNATPVLSPEFVKTEPAPVVSWASAGGGGNFADLASFLDEWVDTDCRDPNKYALIVEGDSMEPVVRAGDRIVIAPNVEPQNGNLVVARLKDSGEVFFKLFHQMPKNRVRLTSYHPAYPPLEFHKTDFRFIQPVWSMTRRMMGVKPQR